MTSTNPPPSRMPSKQDVSALVSLVNSTALLNRQLSSICQLNGLKSSGVKADMQRRIVDHIRLCASDPFEFEHLMRSIHSQQSRPRDSHAVMPQVKHTPAQAQGASAQPAYQCYPGTGPAIQGASYMPATHQSSSHSQIARPMPGYAQYNSPFSFKPSPFYEPRQMLFDIRTLEPIAQHLKNTTTFTLKGQDIQRHLTDPSMRIMVFSATGNTGVQDIAFPYQSEIKVNSGEVKANLRGLKNKAGSTRPVDITDFLRQKVANYENKVEFTYASTNRAGAASKPERFYLCIYVCKTHSVASLVTRISNGNKITRASVVQEITRKAQDTEIVTTSQKLSLKCPLSYMRLELPVRSTACKHIQCFDATSYLQLQQQGPQWLCPICSNYAPFDKLAVDEYAREILANTPKSVEQVTIEPDGEWRVSAAEPVELKDDDNVASYIDDDDVMLSEVSFLTGQRSTATPSRSIALPSTPNTGASREGSSMPRSATASTAGTKRPPPVVVDLTLSDDDDDADLQPPPKRQNTGNSFNSHSWEY